MPQSCAKHTQRAAKSFFNATCLFSIESNCKLRLWVKKDSPAIMINIIPFEHHHQKEIDEMMNEINHEFDQSIFASTSFDKKRSLDKHWVATHLNTVVGTIGLIKISDNTIILKAMFVDKKHRGKEKLVSNKLLATLLHWSEINHIKAIYLGTMQQFKAAQRFYEKNGFERIAKSDLPEDFIHNELDDIFYHKSFERKT